MHAIDTNILIYAFDATEKGKHEKAKEIIKKAFEGKTKLLVTNQILAEFAYVAKTKLDPPLRGEEIAAFTRSVESSENWTIKNYTSKQVTHACTQEGHFWDNLILATIGETKLLTENTKHFTNHGVQVINPFKE